MAVTGSASSLPGESMFCPSLCTSMALVVRVSKLKPNCENASSMMAVPPASSMQALMICTQVVATMPPKITYTSISAPTTTRATL